MSQTTDTSSCKQGIYQTLHNLSAFSLLREKAESIKNTMRKFLFLCLATAILSACKETALVTAEQSAAKREFRGAWIQCVNGQFIGMSTQQMQNTLSYQLDELQKDGVIQLEKDDRVIRLYRFGKDSRSVSSMEASLNLTLIAERDGDFYALEEGPGGAYRLVTLK